jgi:hypothetical protein
MGIERWEQRMRIRRGKGTERRGRYVNREMGIEGWNRIDRWEQRD